MEIGSKKLYEMTQDEFYDFLVIDGVFKTKHKIGGEIIEPWNPPVITEFHAKDLNNIHTVGCECYFERKSDGIIITIKLSLSLHMHGDYSFYLNQTEIENNRLNIENVKFHSIKYLLQKGYWLPLI